MPSGGVSNVVQDMIIDTVTKDVEIEAQTGVMFREKVTDSDVAKEAGKRRALKKKIFAERIIMNHFFLRDIFLLCICAEYHI